MESEGPFHIRQIQELLSASRPCGSASYNRAAKLSNRVLGWREPFPLFVLLRQTPRRYYAQNQTRPESFKQTVHIPRLMHMTESLCFFCHRAFGIPYTTSCCHSDSQAPFVLSMFFERLLRHPKAP
jgi:hypothetical protein